MNTQLIPGSTARERLFNTGGRSREVKLSTGDVAKVVSLKLSARTQLAKACTVEGAVDMEQLIPRTIIACTQDASTGEPMFTVGDLEALSELPAIELDPLWEAAAELNGFSEKAAKDAEKN